MAEKRRLVENKIEWKNTMIHKISSKEKINCIPFFLHFKQCYSCLTAYISDYLGGRDEWYVLGGGPGGCCWRGENPGRGGRTGGVVTWSERLMASDTRTTSSVNDGRSSALQVWKWVIQCWTIHSMQGLSRCAINRKSPMTHLQLTSMTNTSTWFHILPGDISRVSLVSHYLLTSAWCPLPSFPTFTHVTININTALYSNYLIWFWSVRKCFPSRDSITPYIRFTIKFSIIDTLWCIPFQWPSASCLGLWTHMIRTWHTHTLCAFMSFMQAVLVH